MRLRVFVGHSFSEPDHLTTLEDFRATIRASVAAVAADYGARTSMPLDIQIDFEVFQAGHSLPTQIRESLRDADIGIFDISGRSANVVYELGYSHALGMELIVVQDTVKSAGRPIPSDIVDLLVGGYASHASLQKRLEAQLTTAVVKIAREIGTSTRKPKRRSFWFENDVKEIHIVCGCEPERTRFASDATDDYLYIDNFDDRDALFEVTNYLSRAYPDVKLYRHTSRSLPSDVNEANLVLIGGPLTNETAKHFMPMVNCGISYVNSHTGMAFPNGSVIRELLSSKSADGLLYKDVAYFGRFRNPFRRSNHVVLCQGCYTFGTLAACAVFADGNQAQDNIKMIEEVTKMDAHDIERLEACFIIDIMHNRKIVPAKVATGDFISQGGI